MGRVKISLLKDIWEQRLVNWKREQLLSKKEWSPGYIIQCFFQFLIYGIVQIDENFQASLVSCNLPRL